MAGRRSSQRTRPRVDRGAIVSGEWTPAFPGQRPPFAPGNELAFQAGNQVTVRHGFYASPLMRDDDRAEVAEIMDGLRSSLPVYRDTFDLLLEVVACRLWRLRRGYRDLSENGMLRDGKPAPILVDLAKLEGGLTRDLSELGLTPRSMVGLGLDLLRGEGMTLTVTRLHALVAAETTEGGGASDGDGGTGA